MKTYQILKQDKDTNKITIIKDFTCNGILAIIEELINLHKKDANKYLHTVSIDTSMLVSKKYISRVIGTISEDNFSFIVFQ